MRASESYVQWMNQNIGFNPRAQQNSNALSEFVVADLVSSCSAIRTAIQSEALTPKNNSEVHTASAVRTVDLVLCSIRGGQASTNLRAHLSGKQNDYDGSRKGEKE